MSPEESEVAFAHIGVPTTNASIDTAEEFERARRAVRALIGAPVPTYRCSLDSECTGTLTCKGLHT